ncbi:hypothetical protein N9D31_03910, partial [Oligoflexaceae bacterium]|nr:hypothetical protein [Oligoflexaceae bacterium]
KRVRFVAGLLNKNHQLDRNILVAVTTHGPLIRCVRYSVSRKRDSILLRRILLKVDGGSAVKSISNGHKDYQYWNRATEFSEILFNAILFFEGLIFVLCLVFLFKILL